MIIDLFLLGIVVDILVFEVIEYGFVGKVMGYLDVIVDLVYLNVGFGVVDIVDEYKVGLWIKVRIICNFFIVRKFKFGIFLLLYVLLFKLKIVKIKNGIELLLVDIFVYFIIIEKCIV